MLIRRVGHVRVRRGRTITGTKCTKKHYARAKSPKAMFTLVLSCLNDSETQKRGLKEVLLAFLDTGLHRGKMH